MGGLGFLHSVFPSSSSSPLSRLIYPLLLPLPPSLFICAYSPFLSLIRSVVHTGSSSSVGSALSIIHGFPHCSISVSPSPWCLSRSCLSSTDRKEVREEKCVIARIGLSPPYLSSPSENLRRLVTIEVVTHFWGSCVFPSRFVLFDVTRRPWRVEKREGDDAVHCTGG